MRKNLTSTTCTLFGNYIQSLRYTMASNITLETIDGSKKEEYIHAYGLTLASRHRSKFPDNNLATHIVDIGNMEIRDDDVYLATFQKSGTHWVWEIVTMLQKGSSEYETKKKESIFLDFRSPKELEEVPSPRVLNCHYPVKLTPKGVLDKNIKIIHVQRNPKDVFVSFYNHQRQANTDGFTSTFSDFLQLMVGSLGVYYYYPWFKYVKEWETFTEQHPQQILNLYYEDMKEDPVREIKKINKFLNCNNSDGVVEQIAEACSFDNLKKADHELKEDKFNPNKFEMYRKGEVGDWKNWFTVAQNDMVDKWLSDNLVDTNLKFRYSLKE